MWLDRGENLPRMGFSGGGPLQENFVRLRTNSGGKRGCGKPLAASHSDNLHNRGQRCAACKTRGAPALDREAAFWYPKCKANVKSVYSAGSLPAQPPPRHFNK